MPLVHAGVALGLLVGGDVVQHRDAAVDFPLLGDQRPGGDFEEKSLRPVDVADEHWT